MSDKDDSQKTEEPTQKRLEEAFDKGDAIRSQELRHLVMLGGAALAIGMFANAVAGGLQRDLTVFLAQGEAFPMDAKHLLVVWRDIGGAMISALLMPLIVLMAAALAGTLLQQRPMWTTEKLLPKFSKISLIAGIGRLFSAQSAAEFGKGLLKLSVVAAAVAWVVWPDRGRLDTLMRYDLIGLLVYIRAMSLKMFGAAIGVMGVIAAADYLFQRFEFIKKQRMTRQEVRDEMKQSDGDPMIKARVRQIRFERARKRMMAAVPHATVVIINPAHYAVALKYEHQKTPAPVCVAKGMDDIALRIRAVAEENKVPVVENVSLARALYASVEIDQPINPDHYKAVAEVIGFVLRANGKIKSLQRAARR